MNLGMMYGVSKNNGKTPEIIPFVHRVLQYKPSILGVSPIFVHIHMCNHDEIR